MKRTPLKRTPFKRKARKPRWDQALATKWYVDALADNRARHGGKLTCDVTGTVLVGRPDFQVHHAVEKGWLWNHRWDFDDVQEVAWDSRNSMVVLNSVHGDEHSPGVREAAIKRYHLPPAVFDFAEEHRLGSYLDRHYPE